MGLPSPATGTELFLAAILDELQAIRGLLGQGGRQAPPAVAAETAGPVSSQPQSPPVPVHAGEWRLTADDVKAASGPALAEVTAPSTKRTRNRAR